MKLLISACLLGLCCRYDGQSKPLPCLEELNRRFTLIPVCPEVLGGLPVPRPPCEIQGDRVYTQNGDDRTEAYQRGAALALEMAQSSGCTLALLKEKSPSCGCSGVYDGSFTKQLREGQGIVAALLSKNGIRVYGESSIAELMEKFSSGEESMPV